MNILSICIPTYNRAEALDTCLFALCTQIVWEQLPVKVIISDNASEDHTKQVADKWIAKYGFIEYFRNEENIGGIKNFWKVTEYVETKHFWFMGDDALVLPGSLKHVCEILQANSDVSWLILAGTNNPKDQSSYIQEQISVQGNVVKSIDKNKFVCSFWLQTLGCISYLVFDTKKWRNSTYHEHKPYFIYPQIRSLIDIALLEGNLYFSNRLCVINYRADQSHNNWYISKASISIALEFPFLQEYARKSGFIEEDNWGLGRPFFKWKIEQWIRMLLAHPYYENLYKDVLKFERRDLNKMILRFCMILILFKKPLQQYFHRKNGIYFPKDKKDILKHS